MLLISIHKLLIFLNLSLSSYNTICNNSCNSVCAIQYSSLLFVHGASKFQFAFFSHISTSADPSAST
ncbi:MAG: hypothetical protein WCG25_08640 [bacterium]